MTPGTNQPEPAGIPGLAQFELPTALVKSAVQACRTVNTALDGVFYDVPGLRADFAGLDKAMAAAGEKLPSRIIDFDALADPEGSLLLIDAATAPYVHKYISVEAYLTSPYPETRAVDVATITGVGSSALGSAALAWAVSKALRKPVLAIVPGYGVADVVQQALGGWFGFGLHDWLGTKTVVQNALANAAPKAAAVGRQLPASVPDAPTLHGAPVFRSGSGSSDVLHALMQDRARPFGMLVGHSKGALQIGNALRSLDAGQTHGVKVVTLGCPIAADAPGAKYYQYLGLFDALGQLNMWGHKPDSWVPTWHTTNPSLPPEMDVAAILREVA
ncbi:hypothetical protein [Novosphingobium lentum]|uniref:hypothetical protein n=1 Tax=Novosphingobium lentum TaxID=145287 RepID=UPI0012EE8543|nr:hypothetical protein [Novosphingobium lentum]